MTALGAAADRLPWAIRDVSAETSIRAYQCRFKRQATGPKSYRICSVAISVAFSLDLAHSGISPGGSPVALREKTMRDTVGRRTRKSDHKGEVANLAEWI